VALLEEVQAASRRYAHTQIKWARGIELFRWLDANRPPADIVAEIQQHLRAEPYTGMGLMHASFAHTCGLCTTES
jgi:hypothetical protein